jgi:hypothetical protein
VLTRTLGLGGFNDYVPGYVTRANQVQNLFISTMAAYGRSGDVIRTFGSQGGNPGVTQAIVSFAAANKIPIDELATAPYYDNGPAEPSLQAIYDNELTTDQQIDLNFLNLKFNGLITLFVTDHRQILDAAGYEATALVCYEGGPDKMICPTGVNFDARNQAATWHPRTLGWYLNLCYDLQQAGVSQFYDFYYGSQTTTYSWATYWLPNQLPGTGDPVLDALNISNPQSILARSEVGGAQQLWASQVPRPVVTPTTPPTLVPFTSTAADGTVVSGSISFTLGGVTVTEPAVTPPVGISRAPVVPTSGA